MILANDVIIEILVDLPRRRDAVAGFAESGLGLLANDILAQLNAFIADEHRRPRDELTHLVLALTAERAIERILGIAACDLGHSCLPSLPSARQQIGDELGQHNANYGVSNQTKGRGSLRFEAAFRSAARRSNPRNSQEL